MGCTESKVHIDPSYNGASITLASRAGNKKFPYQAEMGAAAERPPNHPSRNAVSLQWLTGPFLDEHPELIDERLTTEQVVERILRPALDRLSETLRHSSSSAADASKSTGKSSPTPYASCFADWIQIQADASAVSAGRDFFFVSHEWSLPFAQALAELKHHFSPRQQMFWRSDRPEIHMSQVFIWMDVLALPLPPAQPRPASPQPSFTTGPQDVGPASPNPLRLFASVPRPGTQTSADLIMCVSTPTTTAPASNSSGPGPAAWTLDLGVVKEVISDATETLLVLNETGSALRRLWCLYEAIQTSRIKGADKLVLLAYHVDFEPLEQEFLKIDLTKAQCSSPKDRELLLGDLVRATSLGWVPAKVDLGTQSLYSAAKQPSSRPAPAAPGVRPYTTMHDRAATTAVPPVAGGAGGACSFGALGAGDCSYQSSIRLTPRFTSPASATSVAMAVLSGRPSASTIALLSGRPSPSRPSPATTVATATTRPSPATTVVTDGGGLDVRRHVSILEIKRVVSETMTSMQALNDTLKNILLESVLSSLEACNDDTDMYNRLFRSARLCHVYGRLDKAEELYNRDLAIKERNLGFEFPDTIDTAQALSMLLKERGRFQEAQELALKSVQARLALGPHDPTTLSSMSWLGTTLRETGSLEQAENMLVRAYAACTAVLGAGHGDTVRALEALCDLLLSQVDRLQEAEPLLRELVAVKRETLGPGSEPAFYAAGELARLLKVLGQQAAAEQVAREALQARGLVLGPKHPDAKVSSSNVAKMLRDPAAPTIGWIPSFSNKDRSNRSTKSHRSAFSTRDSSARSGRDRDRDRERDRDRDRSTRDRSSRGRAHLEATIWGILDGSNRGGGSVKGMGKEGSGKSSGWGMGDRSQRGLGEGSVRGGLAEMGEAGGSSFALHAVAHGTSEPEYMHVSGMAATGGRPRVGRRPSCT